MTKVHYCEINEKFNQQEKNKLCFVYITRVPTFDPQYIIVMGPYIAIVDISRY